MGPIALGGANEINEEPGARDRPPGLKRRVPSSIQFDVDCGERYDFRGVSQSAKDPALQGSADYAFGESGFSIGAWASNVEFDGYDGDIELDLYANYVGEINDTFSWTAGIVRYMYPGSGETETELAIGEYFE